MATLVVVQAIPCQKYLDMSDEDLFYAASEGRRVGEFCGIKNSPSGACDYSVISEPSPTTGYDGWPRNYDDRGRGCVFHPEGKGKCVYLKDESYRHWNKDELRQMCAGSYVQNAAAQLRHAIRNDACGGACSLPQCSDHSRPYCYHCRKCKGNMENCKESFKFCKLCKDECSKEYEEGEKAGPGGDEL